MVKKLKTITRALVPFLKHHAVRASRGEITNAIRNCHAHGLHSIMLHDDGPGNRIRMFYCDENHELWRNDYSGKNMSVAFHTHHCDLTLQIIEGHVYNVMCKKGDDPKYYPTVLDEYMYESALLGTVGSLSPTGNSPRFCRNVTDLQSTFMPAEQLHTVAVYPGQRAAWLVYEGKEDPNYQPLCYTNNPIFDPSNMYMSDPSVALEAFRWLGL